MCIDKKNSTKVPFGHFNRVRLVKNPDAMNKKKFVMLVITRMIMIVMKTVSVII